MNETKPTTATGSAIEGIPSRDEDFVRHIADAYAPAPMTPVRKTRFDARLRERLDERNRYARVRPRSLPWLAAATAAGLLVLARVASVPTSIPTSTTPPGADGRSAVELAGGLGLAEAFAPAADFEASLPADYQAIASLVDEI